MQNRKELPHKTENVPRMSLSVFFFFFFQAFSIGRETILTFSHFEMNNMLNLVYGNAFVLLYQSFK